MLNSYDKSFKNYDFVMISYFHFCIIQGIFIVKLYLNPSSAEALWQ